MRERESVEHSKGVGLFQLLYSLFIEFVRFCDVIDRTRVTDTERDSYSASSSLMYLYIILLRRALNVLLAIVDIKICAFSNCHFAPTCAAILKHI